MGRKRIEEKQPLIRGKIIKAYADTGSFRQTSALVGVSDTCVADIFNRNPDDFAAANKFACKGFHTDADICRRKSMEKDRLEACSSPQLAVMAGIYTDKAFLHQERVQPTGLSYEEIRLFASAVRERRQTIDITPKEEVNGPEVTQALSQVSQAGTQSPQDAGRDRLEHGQPDSSAQPVQGQGDEGA